MGQIVVNVGSCDLTSHNANTAYSTSRYFDIPANAGITSCVATFATHVNTGNFQGKSFSLNGIQAHPNTPWPTSGISLNAALLTTGQNSFRVAVKSQSELSARWGIGDIILTIDYTDPSGSGGDPPAPPNVGTISLDKDTMVAGDSVNITLSPCDSGIYRSIRVKWAGTVISNIIIGQLVPGGQTYNYTFPVNDSYLLDGNSSGLLTIDMESSADITITRTMTISVPSAGSISAPSYINAGDKLSVSLSASSDAVRRYIKIFDTSNTLLYTMVAGQAGGAAISEYMIPTSWCNTYAPNSGGFSVTIVMEVYINGVAVYGGTSRSLTVYVPSSAVPTIGTFTATRDANGVDASITKYVQNYSKVNLAMGSVAGALGSSITSYEITGAGFSAAASSAAFGPFAKTGDITFTAKVTDTRGRTAIKAATINVLPYTPVSGVNLLAYRSNASKVASDEGAYATLRGKRVFSSLGGQNTAYIKGRVYEKGATPGGWTSLTDDVLALFGGSLSVEKGYTAEINIYDTLTTVVYVIQIPTATVGIHITPGATGGGFGMFGQPNRWDFHKPVYANDVILTSCPNPNLLQNWYFRNPVNQRGSTYSTSGLYTIDRWRIDNAGALSVNSGYLSVSIGGWFNQFIEGTQLAGKIVTITVLLTNGTYRSATLQVPTVIDGRADYSGADIYFHIFLRSGMVQVIIRPESAVTGEIVAAKLELGTVSTLHLDPPMEHAVELPKCKRFMRFADGPVWNVGASDGSLTVEFQLPYPDGMRITPTLVVTSDLTGSVLYPRVSWNTPTLTAQGYSAEKKEFWVLFSLPEAVAGRFLAFMSQKVCYFTADP